MQQPFTTIKFFGCSAKPLRRGNPEKTSPFNATALRGPTPVSVTHSAKRLCPKVGVVELIEDSSSGRLVDVLRASIEVNTTGESASVGHTYTGAERNDIHTATVISKR